MKTRPSIVRPRIYIDSSLSLGPGKIDLLRLVRETQSISAAARALGIPYKRAWCLLDTLNKGFDQPVVNVTRGGKGGGTVTVTTLGLKLLTRYSALEQRINSVSTAELRALGKLVKKPRSK